MNGGRLAIVRDRRAAVYGRELFAHVGDSKF